MELVKGIKERRSVRSFLDKEVSREIVAEIVDVARFAPSWKNTQIARYLVVSNKEIQEKIAKDCTYGFTYNVDNVSTCPSLVVVTYVKNRSGFEKDGSFTTSKGDHWQMFDCGIAAQTFCLAAWDKGVGTCIMGIFDEDKVKNVLGLGEDVGIGCLIAMGYPKGDIASIPRKEVEKLLTFY